MNNGHSDLRQRVLSLVKDAEATQALMELIREQETAAFERGRHAVYDEIQLKKFKDLSLTNETPLIMVIDDNANIVKLVAELLEQGGYQVITGQSGEDCMRLLQTYKPDLLILDINLTDSDGQAICDHLRLQYDTRYLPVIFISGLLEGKDVNELNSDEDAIKHYKRYLPKPLDIPTLFQTIEQLRQSQRVAGEIPWTPALPQEIDFAKIGIQSTKEYLDGKRIQSELSLQDKIQTYLKEGYELAGFEYVVVELLSKGKVRVELEDHVERLALQNMAHHMITAYAVELFNRYYPKRVVHSEALDAPNISPSADAFKAYLTQKIRIRFPLLSSQEYAE